MLSKKITFILYDEIQNSVFVSQVLKPLLNLLQENNNLEINLVSFERKRPTNQTLMELIPAHNRLHFILCKKIPFLGKFTLNFAAYQLNKLFKIIKSDEIIARGPLAGYIALKTLNKISMSENREQYKINENLNFKIQARGLCAEEYRFTNQNIKETLIVKKIRSKIYQKLKEVEYQTYKKNSLLKYNKTIESVSSALKEYLVSNFHADKNKIEIAKKDIPQSINEIQQIKWREVVRKELNIQRDQPVYCYSGSYKAWQCIPEIIEYFFKQYKKNPKSFLMILSPDIKELKIFLKSKQIPTNNFALINAKPDQLYKYLAASDIGLLFRDRDIINWVSRPTKMLEYQAVGLKIIHNQTIECLGH